MLRREWGDVIAARVIVVFIPQATSSSSSSEDESVVDPATVAAPITKPLLPVSQPASDSSLTETLVASGGIRDEDL